MGDSNLKKPQVSDANNNDDKSLNEEDSSLISNVNDIDTTKKLSEKKFIDNYGKHVSDGQQQCPRYNHTCFKCNPGSLDSDGNSYIGPDCVPLDYFNIPYRAKIIVEKINEGKSVHESYFIDYINMESHKDIKSEDLQLIKNYYYKKFGKKYLDGQDQPCPPVQLCSNCKSKLIEPSDSTETTPSK